MNKINLRLVFAFLFATFFISVQDIHAQTRLDSLKDYIVDLKITPTDYSIKEKIIVLFQKARPGWISGDAEGLLILINDVILGRPQDDLDFKKEVRYSYWKYTLSK